MLELNKLSYSSGDFFAEYTFNISKSGIYALVGESGSGKSTLINLMGGFLKVSSGSIFFDDENLLNLSPSDRPVSSLFQNYNNFDHLTIFQNIILGIDPSMQSSIQNQTIVSNVMDKLSLKMDMSKFVSELSGGEQQRISLARCWLRNKNLLLLDEPFNALDPGLRKDLFAQLIKMHQFNNSQITIISSHFLDELLGFIDGIIFISNGSVLNNKILQFSDIENNYEFKKYFLGNS
ncbi:ATP-binding cassette domain-containing protein [Alphaproteobacteria bacterium]|nr:ATP-binding cassette domain-containing protein [Alphaproteobacteria bacterium]